MEEYPKIRLEWVPSAYRKNSKAAHKPDVNEQPGTSQLYDSGGIFPQGAPSKIKRPRYK
jgi:hypothetical protein